MAQQELKKQSDKAAEDTRAKARANRFRGRRARGGRGDAMGVRLARGGGGIFEAPAYRMSHNVIFSFLRSHTC